MRSKIDSYGDLEKYIDPEQRTDFLKQINDVVEWLYEDESKSASKEEINDRLQHFKAIGDPIKARQYYYSELDVYFGQFDNLTKHIQSQFEKFPLLSDQQRNQILEKHQKVQEFMNNVKADRDSKQLS